MKIKCLWYRQSSSLRVQPSFSVNIQQPFYCLETLDLDQIIEICENLELKQVFRLWAFQPRDSHPNEDITKWPTKLGFRGVILLSLPLTLSPAPCSHCARWGDWQAVGIHKARWPRRTQNAMAVAGVLDIPTSPLPCCNIPGGHEPHSRSL